MSDPISYPVAKFLLGKLTSIGWKKFTKNDLNEYGRELSEIIYETMKKYGEKYPVLETDKTPFYQSQVLLEQYLQFRFTKELDQDQILNAIHNDKRITPPTPEQLSLFYEIFNEKINKSPNLKELNINFNYREEVFNIREVVDRIETLLLEKTPAPISNDKPKEELTQDEIMLLIRLYDYQSPCKIAAAKGEFESLWVPGDICDMQWGWERTPSEVELSGKPRGNRSRRLDWIFTVKQLVERKYLKPMNEPKNWFELTEEGNMLAHKLKKKTTPQI